MSCSTGIGGAFLKVPAALTLLIVLAGGLASCALGSALPAGTGEYWPTEGWRSVTPESKGFDSAKLAEGLLAIRDNLPVNSVLIIRDGYVIVDANFYPYDGALHDLASVTKSVMTTLVGIAADQGKLKLDQPMLSFFPDAALTDRSADREKITIRHLTNMASGLESTGIAGGEATLQQMLASDDWVHFALDRKVVSEPGTQFVYDSPGMHLLSAIVQKATGMTALDYARNTLFEPLGIHEVNWPSDPQGVTHGWGDLMLSPRDAAKIGYLFLNKGRWDGKQIVSSQWVEQATQRHIVAPDGEGYGYGWWTAPENNGEYYAMGRGGQYIRVIPALNAVVVVTSQGAEWDQVVPYLEQALVDTEKPLPANPAGEDKLKAALAAIQQSPPAQAVSSLPDVAKTVSGVTYELANNSYHVKSIRLDFKDPAEAVMTLTFDDGRDPWTVPVGLDGVYRFYQGENGRPAGCRGRWEDADTLSIDLNTIGNLNAYDIRIGFKGDHISFSASERTGGSGVAAIGKRQP